MTISADELRRAVKGTKGENAVLRQLGERATPPARSKYGNQPTYVDGVRFDSKREALRYVALKILRTAGKVAWFALQPRFVLPGGVEYRADFVVYWTGGRVSVEDVKGMKTKEYRLKKRQVEALYGVKIEEL